MNEKQAMGISLIIYGLIHILWIIGIIYQIENSSLKAIGIFYMGLSTVFFSVWGLMIYNYKPEIAESTGRRK